MSSYDALILTAEQLNHPDLIRAEAEAPMARLVWVDLMVWSKRNRTDGRIRRHMLRYATAVPDAEAAVAAMVESGRLLALGDGWQMVDFLENQWSAEKVNAKIARDRERYENSQSGSRFYKARDGSGSSSTATPPATPRATSGVNRRDRTRPEEEGTGTNRGASRSRSDGATLAPANGAAGTPRMAVTPGDLRILEGIRDGSLCSMCAQPMKADERGPNGDLGKLGDLAMHKYACPVNEDWAGSDPETGGECPPAWSFCDNGHVMPKAMLVDVDGTPYCLASAEMGCGGPLADEPSGDEPPGDVSRVHSRPKGGHFAT